MNDQLQLLTTAANVLWLLLAGFLVFFMQAGFALVETGFTRAKNVAHTMLMNMMVFCIGAIGYWICGFAFQFGAVNHAYPEVATAGAIAGPWAFSPLTLGSWGDSLGSGIRLGEQFGVLGTSGFFLQGIGLGVAGIFAFFLFQMVFMDTAATIPTGSASERIKFIGFVIMGFWVSMIVYPIVGNWVWGGGWLANLGRSLGLGNGSVDFAGSGVVHMTGGAVGLAVAMVLGPRIGRFNKDGSANTIPGHNIPMGVLGAIILFFGWFGFNPGSAIGLVTPAVVDASGTVTTAASNWPINLTAIAAVNTLLGLGGHHRPVRLRQQLGCGDYRPGCRRVGLPGQRMVGEGQDRRPGRRGAGSLRVRYLGRALGRHLRRRQPRYRRVERRHIAGHGHRRRQLHPDRPAADRGCVDHHRRVRSLVCLLQCAHARRPAAHPRRG